MVNWEVWNAHNSIQGEQIKPKLAHHKNVIGLLLYRHTQTDYRMPLVHAHWGITEVSLSGSMQDNTVHVHCVLTLKTDAYINFAQ